ncbi:hypothetical protein [Pseudonocardia sp. HH130629-09]|uniref:hypothetical protein n=1 Tax=Pseudonocardia sp. HH130629-09 TaxID=1641402 RepID=UPI0006CB38FD|nr:hypothetical protein [Pseudonocardia sp. HH130629-09]ALE83404.1 hypothetical protein XF36_09810 [Pseudonocardia sp. HH130629-09]
MILLCERCYSPVDAATERVYRLSHIESADAAGEVTWREAVVHVASCVPAGTVVPTERRAA